jgi:RNA polymerase sigma-70 factor (ECF subfamily)
LVVTRAQEQQASFLMARAQRDDAIAYEALLTMLEPIARAYARRRLGDVPAIEDIAQETLVSVHGARRSYDPRRPFAPWFYAIVSSRLIDAVRHEQRIARREVHRRHVPELPLPAPSTAAVEIDVEAMHAAVAALPARQRDIVHALKMRDESVRDVAARLGMTESAVKVAAHRGYRALRRLLGDRRP